jgi:hypothetical protein
MDLFFKSGIERKLQDELQQLAVDDFMTTGETKSTTLLLKTRNNENPCFLKLYANSKCHYRFVRQFNLKDVSGKLIVKDEK